MKGAASTLNPFAESYIPLALREEASSYNPESASSASPKAKKLPITDDLKLKNQDILNDSHCDPSQIPEQMITDLKLGDHEDVEMDLAYLQMSFPGMSDQSVMDVYTVNDKDLEASMEMLSQLECVESLNSLPDALDIGDVPELVSSAECSSAKSKNMTNGQSSSSR